MVIIDEQNRVIRPSDQAKAQIVAILAQDQDSLQYQGEDLNDALEGAKAYLD